ncbi:Hypothetical predicted protein, partial [Marmota monax]
GKAPWRIREFPEELDPQKRRILESFQCQHWTHPKITHPAARPYDECDKCEKEF